MDSPTKTIPTEILDSASVNDCFREFQQQQDEWDQFLKNSFEELEQYNGRLEQRERDLESQQQDLEQRVREIEEEKASLRPEEDSISQVEHQKCVAQLEGKLNSAREELQQFHDSEIGHAAANDVALERELEQVCAERQSIQEELSDSQQRVAQLESSLEALAQSQASTESASGEVSLEYQQIFTQQAEQLSELVSEREELEQELESVRANASQLNDSLEKSKRQIAEERAEWSVELKQMRQILQRQADMFQAYASNPTVPTTTIVTNVDTQPGEAPASGAADGDQIVGSVMAQFEKIRQQRSKRGNSKNGDAQKHDCA